MSNHDREGSHPSNRDATLERAWRETSDEQPPARLDAAIVAAARQSVAGRGQQPTVTPLRPSPRNWQSRWQPLAAAASVAGLAFVLVQMLPREQSHAPLPQRQESAPVATAAEPQLQPQPQNSRALEVTDDSQASSTRKAVGARERVDMAVDVPAQHAAPVSPPIPAPPAAKAAASASDSAGLLGESSDARRQAESSEMSGRAGPAAAAAPAATATTSERSPGNAAPLDTAAWAAKIATLHAAGNLIAAEHALRDFRAADPDADSHLPESLRSWATTVRRAE